MLYMILKGLAWKVWMERSLTSVRSKNTKDACDITSEDAIWRGLKSAYLLSSVFLQLMHTLGLASGQSSKREKGKNAETFPQPCPIYLH